MPPAVDVAPQPIRAHLLGPARILVGERLIPDDAWPRRKSRSLLLLLLSSPGYRLPRDRVLDLLWPDAAPESALNALYIAIHGLRRVMEPGLRSGRGSSYLEVSGESVALRSDMVDWVDVDAFETALREAAGPQRRDRLAAALALYAGDFLADEPYLDWPAARREHLRASWRDAVLAYADLERDAGRPLLAVPALERVLQDDATDETAYRALMSAYAAAGRREDALRQYERCAGALRDELGIDPGEETRALAEEIRNAASVRPAPTVPSSRFDNLPAAPNPLVGRGREVESLLDLVCRQDVRLVTITGPGGVGKTRLALETASLAADEFADGVCFVSLAAVRSPELVVPSIAHALGVDSARDQPAHAAIQAAHRASELLLVLDNLEQVIDAAVDIAGLLADCPRLTILVTSREPLHLRPEHEVVLPPLPTPDPERVATVASLARYPAVELFVRRAEAVNRAFALTDDNARAVAMLCARLDGLPLAIELAAARVRHLDPDALVAGLADRFALLAGGFRDLPPRQRTMRAAIAWSYDLLEPGERQLFRCLSIFAGGFTEEAAEQVARASVGCDDGRSDLPPGAIAGALGALTEKSLVRTEEGGDSVRYGMLETIREFGLDALDAGGERELVERAHADWCVAEAERAEPELTGPNQLRWIDRLDIEHANMRAALAFLIGTHDAEAAVRLASALWRFWWGRGHAREGLSWLERALALRGAGDAARARALAAAGELAYAVADYERAEFWYGEALTLSRSLGNPSGVADALNGVGLIARTRGDLARAEALHDEALRTLRELGDRRGVASALNNLGAVAYFRGDVERAELHWQEAADLVRALEDTRGLISVLGNLGALALMKRDLERAAAIQREALGLGRRIGDVIGVTRALINLGGVLYELGDLDGAKERFDEALTRCRENGDPSAEAIVLYNLGRVAESEGRNADAAALLGQSLAIFGKSNDLPGAVAGIERLAGLAGTEGRHEQAARLFAAAAAIREATGAARDPGDQQDYDRAISRCRSALGEERFASAWSSGRELSPPEAITEALAQASRNGVAVAP